MTITTKEAEELARAAFGLMDDLPDLDDEIMLGADFLTNLATALRSLAAERDALRGDRNAERNARFKAEAEFSHMQRRIARQRRALAKLYGKRHDKNGRLSSFLAGLTAENARLREALEGIEEYWNGAAESAVDAAEECRERARAALGEKE
jgi:hypothetical protein